jgi:hypothetical protein
VLYLEAAAKARADAVAASHGLLQAVPPSTFTRLADGNVDGLAPEAAKGEGQLIGYYHNAGEPGGERYCSGSPAGYCRGAF